MDRSAQLGPGLVARQRVCRSDERLLWATYRRAFYFDVEGLDALGAPRKNLLSRGALAVGRGVGELALAGVGEVLGGGAENRNDKPPAADHLLFGPRPGCLAHGAATRIDAEPGMRRNRLWVLASARLAVAAPRPAPEPQPRPQQGRSLLGKAVGFGKGVLEVGRDVAKIVSDDLGRLRWPRPSDATAASPDVDGDWVDDPTLGYWATAPHPETAAVRFADHFAHSHGEARLVLSNHRVAVVYPTKLSTPGTRTRPRCSPLTPKCPPGSSPSWTHRSPVTASPHHASSACDSPTAPRFSYATITPPHAFTAHTAIPGADLQAQPVVSRRTPEHR